MELASMFFGFILSFFMYKQSGLNYRLGILGWVTVFWGFWIVGSLISFFIMLFMGFIGRWILGGLVVFFVISIVRKKLRN